MPDKKSASLDIFGLLSGSGGKAADENVKSPSCRTQREELLSATKVKDLYPEGKITINKYTCAGVQCKLCIKACPTNAIYWTTNGIAFTEDLCVHCEACVLACMVDDCIKVTRTREDGKTEQFSAPRDVIVLNNKINAQKRFQRICESIPSAEDYCQRYQTKK